MSIRRLAAVARKEFRHITRDVRTFFLVTLAPTFLLVTLSYVFAFDVERVDVAIRDLDRTPLSREFIASLTADGDVVVVAHVQRDEEITSIFTRGIADVVLVIPHGFADAVLDGGPAQLQGIVDGADAISARQSIGLLESRVYAFVASLRPQLTDGAGGGFGLHMIQIARLYGAEVAGLELAEAKLSAIEEAGALPVHSRAIDRLDPALWGRERPSVVIDLVGQRETLAWGLRALAPGGRMVLLTTFRDIDVPLDPREMVLRQLTLLGSRHASKSEYVEAAGLVASGRIQPVVSHVVAPQDVGEVHRALQEGTLVGRGALQWTS